MRTFKLNESNYLHWAYVVVIFLEAKDKDSKFIDDLSVGNKPEEFKN